MTKKRWSPAEIMKVARIRDPRLSPDNKSVLYTVSAPSKTEEGDQHISNIFLASTNGTGKPQLLTPAYLSSFYPRWSPDGKWVAFLAVSSGALNLCLIKPQEGETYLLTHYPKSIQTYLWAPDSKRIAFVMPESDKEQTKSRPDVYCKEIHRNRLWVLDIRKPQDAQAVSPPDYFMRGNGEFGAMVEDFDWSPDGKSIAAAYSPSATLEDYYLNSGIGIINLDSGVFTPWKKLSQHESLPRFSPDGKTIAYVSGGRESSFFCDGYFCLRSPKGSHYRELALTYNEGPFPDEPSLLGWTADGMHVIGFEPHHTKMQLILLPVDGTTPKTMDIKSLSIRNPALSQDRTHLSFIGQTPVNPPEIYATALGPHKPVQITDVNQVFLKEYPAPKTEVVTWNSKDGLPIEGLLTYPFDRKKRKKAPLLIIVHGGPMRFFDESYIGVPDHYPLMAFAQEGFAILRPNIRGSCGYGKAYRHTIFQEWGGMDMEDISAGIDFLSGQGIIDPDKIGIMGWSYGGYLAAWAALRTRRFKAASIGSAITNLVSMIGTTDIPVLFKDYFGGSLLEMLPLYLERSPLFYSQHAQIPFLIQHGDQDRRVPLSQSVEFYNALKELKKDVEFIVYPKAQHVFTTVEDVQDSLERNLAWFKKHLMA